MTCWIEAADTIPAFPGLQQSVYSRLRRTDAVTQHLTIFDPS